MDVGPDDTGYIAMPLFHSNSLMVGLAPALVVGASVGLARKFSASRFLDDVRRYGATWFNYTGKPLAYLLATPEKPDDADNPLRLAYGNEGSPQVVETVAKRFDVEVVDVFGSTEGAIALDRSGGPPRGSIGSLREDVAIVDPDGKRAFRRRNSTRTAGLRTPMSVLARSSTPPESARSRATTRTKKPWRQPRGTAGTGAATSATSTPTAGSSSPGGPPTGCGWTARTSRRARSTR